MQAETIAYTCTFIQTPKKMGTRFMIFPTVAIFTNVPLPLRQKKKFGSGIKIQFCIKNKEW